MGIKPFPFLIEFKWGFSTQPSCCFLVVVDQFIPNHFDWDVCDPRKKSIKLADWSANSVGSGLPFQRTSTERCVEVACPKAAHIQRSQ